jgi:hypothetical protein
MSLKYVESVYEGTISFPADSSIVDDFNNEEVVFLSKIFTSY